jgi:glycosyltransferase involved in cell wall biosynthesis
LNIFRRENYECAPKGRNVTFINPVDVKSRDIAIELARRNPRVPFLFVEGWQLRPDDRERLFKTISRLSNIEWHNPVSDMRRIYKVTRILLVPSQWEEAWARVSSEAQISGIPVLTSDIGGLPESVGNGGMLFEPQDIDAWDKGLKSIWNDEHLWWKFSEQSR